MKFSDKPILSFWLISALSAFLSPVSAEALRIGATPVPHAEILEFVRPALEKKGVTLDIKVFTDYVQPNLQLVQRKLDANFFQHKPYLDEFNKSRGAALASVVAVHIEPFGAYSKKIGKLDALTEGATVAIPNDTSNGGRALLLLAAHDLIRLRDGGAITATVRDIVSNPKKLRFREIEAATLPRALGQVDLALINTNYALEAGLDPLADALIIEGAQSPYVNILVARPDNATSEALKKLAAALTLPATRKFIEKRYKGAIRPVF
ncbi:MAG: MetQ/NlpA family ABC transporter substrate-binding protein [Azoarcus sp.]|jgi:D-methionine transport system substrate-binding protein|nr:MetQ/NlpA family ABC transporter substrate-binding protein [Azoarcus sp.]